MERLHNSTARRRTHRRRGAALMLCMFIIFLVTSLVVSVLDTETLELSALRNSIDYERALFLANAGVHHAAAELESLPSWRGTVSEGAFPAHDSYTATAVTGDNNTVVVTARGASGAIVRTVISIIEL